MLITSLPLENPLIVRLPWSIHLISLLLLNHRYVFFSPHNLIFTTRPGYWTDRVRVGTGWVIRGSPHKRLVAGRARWVAGRQTSKKNKEQRDPKVSLNEYESEYVIVFTKPILFFKIIGFLYWPGPLITYPIKPVQ